MHSSSLPNSTLPAHNVVVPWSKVAAVTATFWILKIAATTLGETAGDLISVTLNVGYAVSSLILIGIFLAVLMAQLAARTFHPILYWSVILATSTAGTTISDFMDRTLEFGYMKGSLLLIVVLALILALWRWSVGTLSVQNIRSPKVEIFYWSTILISNTLGTALGDFLADDSGLGFFGGAALIGSLLLIVLALWRFTKLSHVLLFWVGFVLTRPFGATLGDVLSKSSEVGGLGFGTVASSAILFLILVATLAWTIWKGTLVSKVTQPEV